LKTSVTVFVVAALAGEADTIPAVARSATPMIGSTAVNWSLPFMAVSMAATLRLVLAVEALFSVMMPLPAMLQR
jgi:hypothetical protein